MFERKWQSLPRFQRTRGVLRLLALWVAHAYQEEHRKALREPLITLGSAPLENPTFRAAMTVRPEHTVLKPGEQASFTCGAEDQYGQQFELPRLEWSATGEAVTAEGLFTAAESLGQFTVRVAAEGIEAIAEIRVTKEDDRQRVLEYREQRLAAGISPGTVNLDVTILGSMFNWAVKCRIIGSNPIKGVSYCQRRTYGDAPRTEHTGGGSVFGSLPPRSRQTGCRPWPLGLLDPRPLLPTRWVEAE